MNGVYAAACCYQFTGLLGIVYGIAVIVSGHFDLLFTCTQEQEGYYHALGVCAEGMLLELCESLKIWLYQVGSSLQSLTPKSLGWVSAGDSTQSKS